MQETRTFWFNPSTLEAETEFMLVGLVLGLAIYNSVLLDFPLPIALYKKLVGQQLSLRDLSDMEPTLGKSLRELLNYSGALSRAWRGLARRDVYPPLPYVCRFCSRDFIQLQSQA